MTTPLHRVGPTAGIAGTASTREDSNLKSTIENYYQDTLGYKDGDLNQFKNDTELIQDVERRMVLIASMKQQAGQALPALFDTLLTLLGRTNLEEMYEPVCHDLITSKDLVTTSLNSRIEHCKRIAPRIFETPARKVLTTASEEIPDTVKADSVEEHHVVYNIRPGDRLAKILQEALGLTRAESVKLALEEAPKAGLEIAMVMRGDVYNGEKVRTFRKVILPEGEFLEIDYTIDAHGKKVVTGLSVAEKIEVLPTGQIVISDEDLNSQEIASAEAQPFQPVKVTLGDVFEEMWERKKKEDIEPMVASVINGAKKLWNDISLQEEEPIVIPPNPAIADVPEDSLSPGRELFLAHELQYFGTVFAKSKTNTPFIPDQARIVREAIGIMGMSTPWPSADNLSRESVSFDVRVSKEGLMTIELANPVYADDHRIKQLVKNIEDSQFIISHTGDDFSFRVDFPFDVEPKRSTPSSDSV